MSLGSYKSSWMSCIAWSEVHTCQKQRSSILSFFNLPISRLTISRKETSVTFIAVSQYSFFFLVVSSVECQLKTKCGTGHFPVSNNLSTRPAQAEWRWRIRYYITVFVNSSFLNSCVFQNHNVVKSKALVSSVQKSSSLFLELLLIIQRIRKEIHCRLLEWLFGKRCHNQTIYPFFFLTQCRLF